MIGILDRLAGVAADRRGVVLVGLWAFAEAIALPVVPDIALGLLALAAPRQALRLFLVALVAALAGTAVLYALAVVAPDAVYAVLTSLPGIDATTIDAARQTVASGSPTAIAGFGPGTPLKVYTFAWAAGPATPVALAVGVVLNRVTRVAPVVLVLALLGRLAPSFLRRHERAVLATYAAAWIVVYALYLGLVPGLR
jgi:membrane protein YqaA with SNARE-associated domain